MNRLRIFSGNSNLKLFRGICEELDLEPGVSEAKQFSDGEIAVEIQENVRGLDVSVIQSICHPSNTNLMELLIMIEALKRASAKSINVISGSK